MLWANQEIKSRRTTPLRDSNHWKAITCLVVNEFDKKKRIVHNDLQKCQIKKWDSNSLELKFIPIGRLQGL